MRPNLIDFATKELSQDAFVAWLIQWASPENKKEDALLSKCATEFVKKLMSLRIKPPSAITSVVVERQWNKIDVWATINEKIAVIIEDKTAAGEHSGQLKKYKKAATSWCKKYKLQLVCVYLKTGSQSAADSAAVERQGFAVFGRGEFLNVLSGGRGITNPIFCDFRDHLLKLEESERRFVSQPIGKWEAPEWRGFYQALEKERPIVNWGPVWNRSGGFLKALLNWYYKKGCFPYMQIESDKAQLCFKVRVSDENNRGAIRDRYHEAFMAYCGGKNGIQSPERLRSGQDMTIASVAPRHWLGGDDALVDMDKVVAGLKKYEDIFSTFLKKMQSKSVPARQPEP